MPRADDVREEGAFELRASSHGCSSFSLVYISPVLTSAPLPRRPSLFSTTTTMSLPLLVNGADCGPVNPLQGLTKTFDRDRGVQQVLIIAGLQATSLRKVECRITLAQGVLVLRKRCV